MTHDPDAPNAQKLKSAAKRDFILQVISEMKGRARSRAEVSQSGTLWGKSGNASAMKSASETPDLQVSLDRNVDTSNLGIKLSIDDRRRMNEQHMTDRVSKFPITEQQNNTETLAEGSMSDSFRNKDMPRGKEEDASDAEKLTIDLVGDVCMLSPRKRTQLQEALEGFEAAFKLVHSGDSSATIQLSKQKARRLFILETIKKLQTDTGDSEGGPISAENIGGPSVISVSGSKSDRLASSDHNNAKTAVPAVPPSANTEQSAVDRRVQELSSDLSRRRHEVQEAEMRREADAAQAAAEREAAEIAIHVQALRAKNDAMERIRDLQLARLDAEREASMIAVDLKYWTEKEEKISSKGIVNTNSHSAGAIMENPQSHSMLDDSALRIVRPEASPAENFRRTAVARLPPANTPAIDYVVDSIITMPEGQRELLKQLITELDTKLVVIGSSGAEDVYSPAVLHRNVEEASVPADPLQSPRLMNPPSVVVARNQNSASQRYIFSASSTSIGSPMKRTRVLVESAHSVENPRPPDQSTMKNIPRPPGSGDFPLKEVQRNGPSSSPLVSHSVTFSADLPGLAGGPIMSSKPERGTGYRLIPTLGDSDGKPAVRTLASSFKVAQEPANQLPHISGAGTSESFSHSAAADDRITMKRRLNHRLSNKVKYSKKGATSDIHQSPLNYTVEMPENGFPQSDRLQKVQRILDEMKSHKR
jgi:hypothetical protein